MWIESSIIKCFRSELFAVFYRGNLLWNWIMYWPYHSIAICCFRQRLQYICIHTHMGTDVADAPELMWRFSAILARKPRFWITARPSVRKHPVNVILLRKRLFYDKNIQFYYKIHAICSTGLPDESKSRQNTCTAWRAKTPC